MAKHLKVEGFVLQSQPPIYSALIPGKWLLKHATPSWRMKNPKKGFQRTVKEERAREIALAVLSQGRVFPNSIVLATNQKDFELADCKLLVPSEIRFLVVDGQHRLWAQHYSDKEVGYSCVIHTGLEEVQMARLFLEINDTQKRVPSSLRWDLVRLVRPDDDPNAIKGSELTYELATNPISPLFQRIDLTGEQGEIDIKQGSLAPELKSLVASRRLEFQDLDFDNFFEALTRFLAAARAVDPHGWRSGNSALVKARVLRALVRTLPDLAGKLKKAPHLIPTRVYEEYLQKIDRQSLSPETIRAVQGSAGIKQIYHQLKTQLGI